MGIRNMLLAVALGALGVATAPSAVAQTDAGAQSAPAPSESTGSAYSDTDLKSFAAAAVAVQAIRDMYVLKIAAAEGQDEQQQLRQAAVREMTSAVEQRGLSVDKFREILVNAQSDPALVEKINEQLNAAH